MTPVRRALSQAIAAPGSHPGLLRQRTPPPLTPRASPCCVRVGPYDFPLVDYDAFGDSLYLGPQEGGGVSEGTTPEGHAFLYPDHGGREVIGVELDGVRRQLDLEGAVTITLPSGEVVRLSEVEQLITRQRGG
jgi:hypothetical protein